MATPETVAYVMQQKYQLGLPLYRQEQYWKAEGVELKRNTLANWNMRSSLWFMPLWNRMKEILVSEDIIHADETPLRVLKRGGVPTDSQSRMWVFCSGQHSSHKMALYFHHATRSAKVVTELFGNYVGYLQTDGYAAYLQGNSCRLLSSLSEKYHYQGRIENHILLRGFINISPNNDTAFQVRKSGIIPFSGSVTGGSSLFRNHLSFHALSSLSAVL